MDLGVAGLIFLGFPLYPPGKPGTDRAAHLGDVGVPMLYVQGTRDKLADLEILRPVLKKLRRTKLHVVEGGDHSFGMLKRSGRSQSDALDELADTIHAWTRRICGDG